MTTDPSNDNARNLDELRRIAYKHGGPNMTRSDVEARLRHDPDALTFMARLRRSGMSDAAVSAAVFDHPNADA